MGNQPPTIADLVQGFARNIRDYKDSQTKEAEIRQKFIDPFWRALGWDVGDSAQRGPALADVIIEKSVETAEAGGFRSRRPDYLFRLGGFPRFTVEAKRPFIDIDTDDAAIFQAKQYAWNSTIPFAILTDFEQFRLYDTTLKPIFGDRTALGQLHCACTVSVQGRSRSRDDFCAGGDGAGVPARMEVSERERETPARTRVGQV